MDYEKNKVMKVNEAPEKIYVHWSKHAKRLCASAAQGKGDIEYIRTDAFIEKAKKWFDMHFHETEVNDRWGESRCVVMSGYDSFKDDLLKDFTKYMKGE